MNPSHKKPGENALRRIQPIVWILAAAVVLRLPFLFRAPIGDEGLTLQGVRRPIGTIVPYLLDPANHDPYPPLFYWLMHIWDAMFGNAAADRFLLLIMGVACVYVTYRIAIVLADKRLGVMSALLMACFPQTIWIDQWLRAYSMAALLSCLLAYGLFSALAHGSRWPWVVLSFAGIALLFTFYFGAVVLTVLGLGFLFLAKKERGKRSAWVVSQLIIILGFVLWIPKMLVQSTGSTALSHVAERRGVWLGGLHIGALFNGWLGTVGLDPYWAKTRVALLPRPFLTATIVMLCVVSALLFRGMIKCWRTNRELARWLLWCALSPAVLGLVVHHFSGVPVVHHYYSIVCWAGAIMVAACILHLEGASRFVLVGILSVGCAWRLSDMFAVLVLGRGA